MADPRNATQELIEDRPEFESKLRLLLEIDTRRAVWDFGDIPLDAGEFGEIVSYGLVQENDAGYKLVDPDTIRATLDGDGEEEGTTQRWLKYTFDINGRWLSVIASSLLFFVAIRVVFVYGSVFQSSDVV
ncbi:hypothetical protein QA599_21500, partial [Haloarculaceae archaeon H-GB1-1]|nr:hypothetical protein [Haloarculaceae archaeon H-GB1-1]